MWLAARLDRLDGSRSKETSYAYRSVTAAILRCPLFGQLFSIVVARVAEQRLRLGPLRLPENQSPADVGIASRKWLRLHASSSAARPRRSLGGSLAVDPPVTAAGKAKLLPAGWHARHAMSAGSGRLQAFQEV